MKQLLFEWKKIIRKKMLWLIFIILVVLNTVTLDRSIDSYSADCITETAESYQDYIDTITEQIDSMKSRFEEEKDGFNYRNVEKIEREIRSISMPSIREGSYQTLYYYSSYSAGILFVIVFLCALVDFLFQSERRQGLLILFKQTREGHLRFLFSKVFIGCIVTVLFVLTMELVSLLYLINRYGLDELESGIQVLLLFRGVFSNYTILELVCKAFMYRCLSAIGVFIIIFSLQLMIRKNWVPQLIMLALTIMELLLSMKLTSSSSLNYIWAVTFFNSWDIKASIATEMNLNIMGYPVSHVVIALIYRVLICIVLFSVGVWMYECQMQIVVDGIISKLVIRIRTIFLRAFRTVNICIQEWKKILVHEKRWMVVVVLLFVFFSLFHYADRDREYAEFKIGEYHKLLDSCQGRITDDSLLYVSKKRIDLEEQLDRAYSPDNIQADGILNSLGFEDEGLQILEEQRDRLLSMEGSIYDKYFIDEYSYLEVMKNYRADIFIFFMLESIVLLMTCSLESYDDEKGMNTILNATRIGEPGLRKVKNRVFWSFGMIAFLLMEIASWYALFRIDRGVTFGQQMNWFTQIALSTGLTILQFYLLVTVIRAGCYFLYLYILKHIIDRCKQATVVLTVGVGLIVVPLIVFMVFHMSITLLLIQIFS